MVTNKTGNNATVSLQAISQINGQEDFVSFLRTELEWPIPFHIDHLDDVSIPHDLQKDFGFSAEEDRIQVSRLLNLSEDQPWGIFLFEFKTRRPYLSHLRRLLRVLGSRRTLQRGDPIWDRNDLLFICTQNWKEFQFVHFSGERPDSAIISSFGWKGPEDRFLHTLCKHNLPRLRMPEADLDGSYPSDAWRAKWREAFNIKPVTDEFYTTLKEVFHAVESGIRGLKGEQQREFTELLINRLIFLKFVEKKGWLNNDRDYLFRQFQKYGGQRYWKEFLFHLFFEGLNTDPGQRLAGVNQILGDIPFLNAELFSFSDKWDDRQVEVEGRSLDLLFDKLLNPYNFTVAETSPLEVEVAFNQDLLGYAYEELIADQHGQGAYYTHPTEVNLMCRESLRAYLEERCPVVEKETTARLVYGELLQNNRAAMPLEHAIVLYSALHDVTICDPAIGSGTFPVAMVKHLFTCLRSLGQLLKEYAPFRELIDQATLTDWRKGYELKLHIIERSIYGCDIDYFAVQIAKLRFWIELMVECERPVPLPNFDFKLLVGDALLSVVGSDSGGTPITLEEMWGHPTRPRGQVNLSTELLKKFAEKKKTYYGVQDPYERFQLRKELLHDREQLINQALRFSRPTRQRTDKHILWQIDFAEEFQGKIPGFDIVIANPPYLRHELIDNSFHDFEISLQAKTIREVYSNLSSVSIDGKSDLYIYFFFRSLMILKEKGGTCCFICSNSWLDVKYGSSLQNLILSNTSVRFIIDNLNSRSFANAAINTTINIFVTNPGNELGKVARFCSFRRSFNEWGIDTVLDKSEMNETYRLLTIPHSQLRIEGLDDKKKYSGGKWGAYYLRAPDILFSILKLLKNSLVLVRDVAEVRFGIKTGANDFFLLDQNTIEQWGIEKEFLIPILKSPKEVSSIYVVPSALPLSLFVCNLRKQELIGKNALDYIIWGEKQGFCERPSTSNRSQWWSIGDRKPALINCNYQIHHVMKFYAGEMGFFVSNNFHEIHPRKKNPFSISVSLNSSLSQLWINATGRANLGDGLLKVEGYEAETIPLFSPELLHEDIAKSIIMNCNSVGLNGADRNSIDNYIFSSANIPDSMRTELIETLQFLVSQRINKAGSL